MFHVLTRDELELPYRGDVELEDLETGATRPDRRRRAAPVPPRVRGVPRALARALRALRHRLHRVITDSRSMPALRGYLSRRAGGCGPVIGWHEPGGAVGARSARRSGPRASAAAPPRGADAVPEPAVRAAGARRPRCGCGCRAILAAAAPRWRPSAWRRVALAGPIVLTGGAAPRWNALTARAMVVDTSDEHARRRGSAGGAAAGGRARRRRPRRATPRTACASTRPISATVVRRAAAGWRPRRRPAARSS